MGFISQSHVPCQPAGSSLGTPLLPCRRPALPYRVPLTALDPLGLGTWPGVLLGGCLGSQSALSRGTQAGERGLGPLIPGPSEFLSPGAVGQGFLSPGTRGHGRKRQAQSLMFFLFSFQIIGISLSQFNIWSFLFKRKGKGLFVLWVCFCRLCFRSRVLPQACGPLAVPWQGLRLSSAPVSLCLQPLSYFISIFIFVLLLS